jgi:hypothetical protein
VARPLPPRQIPVLGFERLSYLLDRALDWLGGLLSGGDSPRQTIPPAAKTEEAGVRAPLQVLADPPTNHVWRSYYYAGGQRVAVRVQYANPINNILNFLISDHLGSTSITMDHSGNVIARLLYDPWKKVRYSSGATPTNYTYTGQYSYTADFGLMYYGQGFTTLR